MKVITILGLTTASILSNCNISKHQSIMAQTNKETSRKTSNGYASLNGLKMYYEISGEGTPLVLVHGGGSTLQTTFGRIIPELSKNHKVIAVEMQAHGHTADIDRPLSFQQDADDLALLLKTLNIDKANVFGFSNGASTTLHFAIRHPRMTGKIIIASTFYKKSGAPDWFWEMMSKPTFAGMPQIYKDAYLKINPDSSALYRMYERDVARMQSFEDIPEQQIKSIDAPSFIIIGDKDVVKMEHAVEMQGILPNSRLAIIPGGHGDYIGEISTPQNSTLISATIAMINNFLKD